MAAIGETTYTIVAALGDLLRNFAGNAVITASANNTQATASVHTFSLAVDATMDFPSWTDRNAAPEALKNKWDGFARILRAHEDGHKENGIKAANDLANRLRALPAERDCAALDQRINALGQRITSEYRYLDQAYDRATNHGVNQGATLF